MRNVYIRLNEKNAIDCEVDRIITNLKKDGYSISSYVKKSIIDAYQENNKSSDRLDELEKEIENIYRLLNHKPEEDF